MAQTDELERIVPHGTEDFAARPELEFDAPSVRPALIFCSSPGEIHGCCSGLSRDAINQTSPTAKPMNAHIQNE